MNGSCSQLTIDVPEQLKDILSGEFADLGAAGIWESGEPAPGLTRLEIYFTGPFEFAELQQRVRAVFIQAQLAAPEIRIRDVEDRDWLAEWKKSFVSFPAGKRFYIIPSWCDPAFPDGRLPIYIDPGQAFGTGTHETTQLMMESMEDCVRGMPPETRIFDLGTGSGILLIAASLLGFTSLVGCDNDANSVLVAAENLQRNGVAHANVFCGSIDAVPADAVDLLLCNLTTEVIVDLFAEISRVIRPGATGILSGILVDQRGRILETLAAGGFAVVKERIQGEWLSLVIRKPANAHGG